VCLCAVWLDGVENRTPWLENLTNWPSRAGTRAEHRQDGRTTSPWLAHQLHPQPTSQPALGQCSAKPYASQRDPSTSCCHSTVGQNWCKSCPRRAWKEAGQQAPGRGQGEDCQACSSGGNCGQELSVSKELVEKIVNVPNRGLIDMSVTLHIRLKCPSRDKTTATKNTYILN
jgi:hypothetical protein